MRYRRALAIAALGALLTACAPGPNASTQPTLETGASAAALGTALEVGPGVQYSIQSLRIGGEELCSNAANTIGPLQGYFLFVTVAIETQDLTENSYPFFEESDFFMTSRSGQPQALRAGFDNKVNLGCLDLSTDAIDHVLRPNARQVGIFVVDTHAPTGTITLQKSGRSFEFTYPAETPDDSIELTGGYGPGAPPIGGSSESGGPIADGATVSPCQAINRETAESILDYPLAEEPKRGTIAESERQRTCSWLIDAAAQVSIAATASCPGPDLDQWPITLEAADVGIPGAMRLGEGSPFILYFEVRECFISVQGIGLPDLVTANFASELYRRY